MSRFASAVVLLVALGMFGVLAGGAVATRLMGPIGVTGWDGIASALGGVMSGGVIALGAWLVALWTLEPRARMVLALAAVVLSVATWLWLASSAPNRETATTAITRPPASAAVEPFTFHLSTADGLEGPSPANERLIWQFLRISSNLSFDYVPAGRPDQQCIAEHLADDLNGILRYHEFRDILTTIPEQVDCGPPCPSCGEVGLEWFLDQDRQTLALTDRCWNTHEQLQKLRMATEGIVAAAYGRVICN